jgi:hypothetical protein
MNNAIQTYNTCLHAARDARAEATREAFHAMGALLRKAPGARILATAAATIALVALISF